MALGMTLEQYRNWVRSYLTEKKSLGEQCRPEGENELITIFDREKDHYQLLEMGWTGYRRTFRCILHVDIKNDQIWIQQDETEEGLANRLVELGVPHEAIVLAFHEPELRQYSEFATGKERSLQLQV
jgi:hypothetical protein